MRVLGAVVLGMTLIAACGSNDGASPGQATLADLRAAVARGDGCADLIEVKNNMDPKSADYEAAPDVLRAVGCYSKSSTRTDQ